MTRKAKKHVKRNEKRVPEIASTPATTDMSESDEIAVVLRPAPPPSGYLLCGDEDDFD